MDQNVNLIFSMMPWEVQIKLITISIPTECSSTVIYEKVDVTQSLFGYRFKKAFLATMCPL